MDNEAFNNDIEQIFVAKFLSLVASTPKFDFVLDFMEERDRENVKKIIDGLDKIGESDEYKTLKKMYETL